MAMSTLLGVCATWACDRGASPTPVGRSLAGQGVIEGTVTLAPGVELPGYAGASASLRTLMPSSERSPASDCPDPAAPLYPVAITAERRLSGVVLAASEFTGSVPHTPRVHDVAVHHCRLQPSVVDATRGDRLRVRNLDPFPYAPSFGPARQEQPLPRDRPVMIPLGASGVESILCPLSAPCGRTDVITFNHPLHARTDAAGTYRLEGFPVGERVRISAWHPLFEPTSTHVWLERGERRRVDLTLAPRAP